MKNLPIYCAVVLVIIAIGFVAFALPGMSKPAALASQPVAPASQPAAAAPRPLAAAPQSDADALAALAKEVQNSGDQPAVLSDFNEDSSSLIVGDAVTPANGQVTIDVSQLKGSQAHFYNVKLPSGKTIYFFVVRDQAGVYRAAANACQVCFRAARGFHQEGNWIVCNTCGNRYPLEKIATEKGGCNPGPINPKLPVKGNSATIQLAELEQVSELF
jgi:hypothetical protein